MWVMWVLVVECDEDIVRIGENSRLYRLSSPPKVILNASIIHGSSYS